MGRHIADAEFAPDKLYTLPDSPHAARLRELDDQEITQLLRRASNDLALDLLGLLTVARGGPLTAADLATLTGSRPWKVRGVLDGEAARTQQQAGPANAPRYTFAHETLLARCQQQGVGDPGHTRRIHEWAASWRDRGWPAARDGEERTLWVPTISSTSRDQAIFVNRATGASLSSYAVLPENDRLW